MFRYDSDPFHHDSDIVPSQPEKTGASCSGSFTFQKGGDLYAIEPQLRSEKMNGWGSQIQKDTILYDLTSPSVIRYDRIEELSPSPLGRDKLPLAALRQ
jgi:hypothetical protein